MMDAIETLSVPSGAEQPSSPAAAQAAEGRALVRCLSLACLALAGLLAAALAASHLWALPALMEARRSGVLALPLSALLLGAGALLGTWAMARARAEAAALVPLRPYPVASRRGLRRLWPRRRIPAFGDPAAIGRAARWPQVRLVAPCAAGAAALALLLPPATVPLLAPPATAEALAGGAFALAFVLLLAERTLAATPAAILPEAAALRALALLATLGTFAAGLLQVGAVVGLPFTPALGRGVGIVLAAVGAELALRALGRAFLPPPAPETARAATSLLAGLLGEVRDEGGFVAPIRRHFGIDFARSWALAYARAAALPLLAGLGVLAWLLTAVVLVPQDGRAVAERFGAPVRVLHPGLHLVLPWPLGSARRVDFGAVHELTLTNTAAPLAARAGAEDPAPLSADRMWGQVHPSEVSFLIASESRGQQTFQSMSADLRVLWRVGLSDADAERAAYRIASPDDLVRAAAGRVTASYFAVRTLDDLLGASQTGMGEALRTGLQRALDARASGLEAVAVVIEAVHPPPGAADAYHAVQAAEIDANAQVSAERGRAAAALSASAQYAHLLVTGAQGLAADVTGNARADLARFLADRDAAAVGGHSFLLERYFNALVSSLSHTQVTVLDHRIPQAQAPTLDLRPLANAAAASGSNGE